jgi:hypothetical protein
LPQYFEFMGEFPESSASHGIGRKPRVFNPAKLISLPLRKSLNSLKMGIGGSNDCPPAIQSYSPANSEGGSADYAVFFGIFCRIAVN